MFGPELSKVSFSNKILGPWESMSHTFSPGGGIRDLESPIMSLREVIQKFQHFPAFQK